MAKNIVVTESYLNSIFQLTVSDRKRVLTTISELMNNPKSPSLSIHQIDRMQCDDSFRSARVNDNFRIIFSSQGDRFVLLYVDKHDDAYQWCNGKYLKKTDFGSEYIYDEAVYATATKKVDEKQDGVYDVKPILENHSIRLKDLTRLGISEIHAKTLLKISDDDTFIEYVEVFPSEIQEALLDLAGGKPFIDVYNVLNESNEPDEEIINNANTRRRFYAVENIEELEKIMESESFEKWKLFLHPSQEFLVRGNFNGPVLVEGGPGTGKTVVGVHRAVRLAKDVYKKSDNKKILVCTYSKKLAGYIGNKINELCLEKNVPNNIDVYGIDSLIYKLLEKANISYHKTELKEINNLFTNVYASLECKEPIDFYKFEYQELINKNNIKTEEEYLACDRTGMGKPLNESRRREVWKFFSRFISFKEQLGYTTFIDRARLLLKAINDGMVEKQYDSIIVDEAQDLEPIKIKVLYALAKNKVNSLLLLSDSNQRIYKLTSWKKETDLNIVGRSYYLNINYRTTKQINDYALNQFIESEISKLHIVDYKNILVGEDPTIQGFMSDSEQLKFVVSKVREYLQSDIKPYQIAVVGINKSECEKLSSVFTYENMQTTLLNEDKYPEPECGVCISTLSGIKGLEFEVVIIYNYNEINKYNIFGDSEELNYNKLIECLKYVASTRARAELVVTYIMSEE